MCNLTSVINVNVPSDAKEQPTREFAKALKELDYMEKHTEEYKAYHDVDKMFEDILNKKY